MQPASPRTLQTAGVAAANPSITRALAWLKSHQDPQTAAWPGSSMNKVYPKGSMEAGFVQDAATAVAPWPGFRPANESGAKLHLS
jgi:hypothetical protein